LWRNSIIKQRGLEALSERRYMRTGEGFEKLVDLMARLRSPDGCPWDREQTLESLRPFILEEAYELVDAIDSSNTRAIKEELGDLLLEVLFVSQVCSERSHFTIQDVMRLLEDKLIRRHPHVFGMRSARNSDEALASWEDMKDKEKAETQSVLGDVPRALPALVRAYKLSTRAAREGFDWKSADDVFDKLGEEIRELEKARSSSNEASLTEEVGDLLFAVVNLARHLGVDPELALQSTNRKFLERFHYIEARLAEQDRSPADSSMEELEALWQEAKQRHNSTQRRKDAKTNS
jgi:MazG family protein